MARIDVPYLKLRDGRPRWEPGPRLRDAGYKGRDLKDEGGRWLSIEAAVAVAREINAAVANDQAGGRQPRPRQGVRRATRSCEALADQWLKSADFSKLGPRTRRDYVRKLAVFLAEFGDAPVAAVTKPQLVGWWQEMYSGRGHHMATGTLAVASSMLSYAELIGWRDEGTNPALKMRRPRPDARLVLWLPAEIDALLAAADTLQVPSIGDAIIIGLHTGQRQGDVLAMPPRLFEEGRIKLRQFKRGALIDAPLTNACATRVEGVRARWRASGIATRETIVARDGDGAPYLADHFRAEFARVRTKAAETMPDVAGKRFQDLRDTAVTRLALAGCTMPEIGAITGHAQPTIAAVMRHYLVQSPAMADAAISKLEAWMQREGIAR